MFGLFKKKDAGIRVIDTVWISEQARREACYRAWQKQPATQFLAWFEESRNQLEQYFRSQGATGFFISLAGFPGTPVQGAPLLFIEHFPLRSEEQAKFTAMGLQEVRVYNCLEEPLFRLFGGARLIATVERLGYKPDEPIEHELVTTSIRRAQDKLAEKTIISGSARSQEDWFINAGFTL